MDVSVPYESVVPSLEGPVLEVLAKSGKPLSGRQIQRLARRGSVPGIASVLEHLVESGLVFAERGGSAIFYRMNRDHLVWPAVEILVGIRPELLLRLRALVASWSVTPTSCVLFGSAARGDGDTSSDIDILIVHSASAAPSEDELDDLRLQVLSWTGNHAQLVVIEDATWLQMKLESDPFVESVQRDGIDLLSWVGGAV